MVVVVLRLFVVILRLHLTGQTDKDNIGQTTQKAPWCKIETVFCNVESLKVLARFFLILALLNFNKKFDRKKSPLRRIWICDIGLYEQNSKKRN